MDLPLTLKKHCIETETKKAYERLIKQYFNKNSSDKEKQDIEYMIDRLKFFLEHADFQKLRSRYPELSGTAGIPVTLKITQDIQHLRIIFNDKSIQPEWKK